MRRRSRALMGGLWRMKFRKRGREKEICIAMAEEQQGYGPSIGRKERWFW